MANFNVDTTMYGIAGSTALLDSASDMSEWYRIATPTVSSASYVHIRTPWPTDAGAGMGWNPYIIEVVGYGYRYSTAYNLDLKAVVNTTGDGNNTWYGNQIKVNATTSATPYVYRSTSAYGGYTRVCFSLYILANQAVGYIWIKCWTNAGYRTSYAWAQTTSGSQTGAF